MNAAQLSAAVCLLFAAAVLAAPAGDDNPKLVQTILKELKKDLNTTTSKGDAVSKTEAATETVVNVPGPSSSQAVLTAAGGTPNGKETAASTVIATGEGDGGKNGISATMTAVNGGAATDDKRALSGGTAVVGSIAVTDGKISTSSAIVKTAADTDKGSKTETLGLTASIADDGSEAKGIQQTGSEASSSKRSTAQADLGIGSGVGDISTRVNVAGGSEAAKNDPPKKPKDKALTTIAEAKKRLGLS